jgi:hypothetical protein
MPVDNFIEPVPVNDEPSSVRQLRDDIALAVMLCGDDSRGRKIISRLKSRLAAALGTTGRATDAAAATRISENDRLNAEYAARLGKQIKG